MKEIINNPQIFSSINFIIPGGGYPVLIHNVLAAELCSLPFPQLGQNQVTPIFLSFGNKILTAVLKLIGNICSAK